MTTIHDAFTITIKSKRNTTTVKQLAIFGCKQNAFTFEPEDVWRIF